MKSDDLLEKNIDSISEKISEVESFYLQLAARRLKKIYSKTPKELQVYLYSAEFLEDTKADMRKVEKLLKQAHKQNIKDMAKLYKEVIKEAADVGSA